MATNTGSSGFVLNMRPKPGKRNSEGFRHHNAVAQIKLESNKALREHEPTRTVEQAIAHLKSKGVGVGSERGGTPASHIASHQAFGIKLTWDTWITCTLIITHKGFFIMENNEYYHTMVEIDGVYFDVLLNKSEIKEGVQRAIDYPSMVNPHGQCVDCGRLKNIIVQHGKNYGQLPERCDKWQLNYSILFLDKNASLISTKKKRIHTFAKIFFNLFLIQNRVVLR